MRHRRLLISINPKHMPKVSWPVNPGRILGWKNNTYKTQVLITPDKIKTMLLIQVLIFAEDYFKQV